MSKYRLLRNFNIVAGASVFIACLVSTSGGLAHPNDASAASGYVCATYTPYGGQTFQECLTDSGEGFAGFGCSNLALYTMTSEEGDLGIDVQQTTSPYTQNYMANGVSVTENADGTCNWDCCG
jgi:hypothetical protein